MSYFIWIWILLLYESFCMQKFGADSSPLISYPSILRELTVYTNFLNPCFLPAQILRCAVCLIKFLFLTKEIIPWDYVGRSYDRRLRVRRESFYQHVERVSSRQFRCETVIPFFIRILFGLFLVASQHLLRLVISVAVIRRIISLFWHIA